MISLRSLWLPYGSRIVLAASLALALPLLAEPTDKPAAARKKGAKAAPPAPTSAPRLPAEVADAFPSPRRPTSPDLLLSKDEERKADALAAFSQGLIAEDNAEQEKMIEAYRKALELDPTYAELAVKLAYELTRRDDPSSGVQILKDTIKAAPKEAVPYIYLSQIYSRDLKKPEVGLKYAEQALALAPDNFAAYLAVYEIDMAMGQAKKAEQLLDRAAKSEHGDAKYWTQLGDLFAKLYLKEDGSCDPAQLAKMNGIYRKAADIGKDDPQTLTRVADYFVLSKQTKDAVPFYRAVLSLPPGPNDPPLDNVRDKLARCYLVTGQQDEAIHELETIVKDNTLRYETYELLGELYEQKNDLDKALANYEHSLLLDTSQPRNHLRVAQLLMQAKRWDRAVEIMQAARKKFAEEPEITFKLGVALSMAKRYPEAMAAFSDAQAEAQVGREEALTPDFYLIYGEAAEQAGLYEKAAELIKQSLEMKPDSPEACNYLGYMWIERGEHLDEAGELIKKAISLEPDKGEYIDSLGWYYFRKGDYDRALTELLRAEEAIVHETKKDDATVLGHIGDTYAKQGKMSEALTYWQKSLAIEEDKKSAEKTSEKIEQARQKLGALPPAPESPAAPSAPPSTKQ
jgi:tetratricopeptide (TPR) repeat protein